MASEKINQLTDFPTRSASGSTEARRFQNCLVSPWDLGFGASFLYASNANFTPKPGFCCLLTASASGHQYCQKGDLIDKMYSRSLWNLKLMMIKKETYYYHKHQTSHSLASFSTASLAIKCCDKYHRASQTTKFAKLISKWPICRNPILLGIDGPTSLWANSPHVVGLRVVLTDSCFRWGKHCFSISHVYNMFLPLLVFVWKLSPQEFLSKQVGIKWHQWYHLSTPSRFCAMLCLILPIHTLHKALGTFLQRPLSQHASQVRNSPSDRPVKRGRLYSQRDCQIFITIWGVRSHLAQQSLAHEKGEA